jgi:dipeptidyl aminopeptidase/acylaminoacyl peptidase
MLLLALLAAASATAAAPTVAELIETSDLTTLRVAPDGRQVAFRIERADIASDDYRLDWYVADLRGGNVRRVGGGGEPIFAGPGPLDREEMVWSPDSRFIHYRALIDGGIGVWRAAADGSGSRQIVSGEADVERIAATPDGEGLVYVTGPTRDAVDRAERKERDEGVLVDASIDIAQPLFRGGSVNGRPASQRLIGRWYARAGLLWREPRIETRLDLRTLQTSVERRIDPDAPAPLTVSLDQRRTATSASGDVAMLVLTSGTTTLEAGRRGSASTLRCTAPLCSTGRIGAFLWRPGLDQILFTTRDHHFRQTLAAWDVGSNRVRRIAGGEGLLAGLRDWTEPCAVTRATAVCVAAAATSPPRLVAIDLDTGRSITLFDPNAALRARAMPLVEQLRWPLADGRTASATLLLPARSPRRAPLYVNYYSCPGFLRAGEGEDYPFAPLVEAGFVVACMNMVRFQDASNGVGRYRDALEAVRGLVERLERRGLIDPQKVGMGGFSAGSEATTWVLMNSDLLSAAGVASSQYTPSAYWFNAMRGSSIPADLRRVHDLGAPDETPERWRLISPALNVDRIRAPLLMQLPEEEARHQMEYYSRLSNTATPVELHAYPGAAHIKMAPRQRFAVGLRNVDWFRYWLQDHVDPDPSKAAQYRRWDRLRARSGSARK